MTVWYYVEGKDKVGPIEEEEFINLFKSGILNEQSYVWRKGFDNWAFSKDVDELKFLFESSESVAQEEPSDDVPDFIYPTLDWDTVDYDRKMFSIKIGRDRGGESDVEYGPYSLNFLRKLMEDNRITPKTFIFTHGMDNWLFLADIPIYEKIFQKLPPAITDEERRNSTRKPFVARIFFHNNEEFFDGVCRDISIGGMQILVSDFIAKTHDVISLNVHPENSDYGFVASGEIVRMLEGGQGFSLRFRDLTQDAKDSIEKYIQNS